MPIIYKLIVFMNTEHRDGKFNKIFQIPIEKNPFSNSNSVIQSGNYAVRNGLKLYSNKGAQVFGFLSDIPGNLENKEEAQKYDWTFEGMEVICMELVKVVVKGTFKAYRYPAEKGTVKPNFRDLKLSEEAVEMILGKMKIKESEDRGGSQGKRVPEETASDWEVESNYE